MLGGDIEGRKVKTICSSCVGEAHLRDKIAAHGCRSKCSYCGGLARTYAVGRLAARVATAFGQHYVRTPDQPDGYQRMLSADPESPYHWARDGEPVVAAIMNAAAIPEAAARDVQAILDGKHGDPDRTAMGEETEFSPNAHYEQKGIGAGDWHEEWDGFERSLKTEARFFSRGAADHLAAVFAGIDQLRTRDDRPLVVDAGPGTAISEVYRARAFQSDDKLREALCRPDVHLGSPPTTSALAGRMNAQGISVFYGANDARAAVAEVRAPVGSQVAVARFELVRPLRLLDLTAVSEVGAGGSVFDVETAGRMERAAFLRSLSHRITRPVMPDDEPLEYLATQAIADFLATGAAAPTDGIIYPSVQAAGNARNVVLFHKAARVAAMEIPAGTKIWASTGWGIEDTWVDDYTVIEELPRVAAKTEAVNEASSSGPADFEDFLAPARPAPEDLDADRREPGLRVAPDSVRVHRVLRVAVDTREHPVHRQRWEAEDPPGF